MTKRLLSVMLVAVMTITCALLPISIANAEKASNRILVYNQYGTWSNKPLLDDQDTGNTMKSSGCHIYAYAHAIQWLTGIKCTSSNGGALLDELIATYGRPWRADAQAKYHSLITSKYNAKSVSIPSSVSALKSHFDNGGVIIANPGGHYILAVGYTVYNGTTYVHIVDSSVGSTVWRVQDNYGSYAYTYDGFQKMTDKNKYWSGGEFWLTYDTFQKLRRDKAYTPGSYSGGLGTSSTTQLMITKQPAETFAATGVTAKTTVTAAGDGLNYQWYWKNASDMAFQPSSCTTDSYTTSMTAAKHGRQVYCVVTDKYGNSVTSKTATLYLLGITSQPKNTTAAAGKTASVSLSAAGEGLIYRWYWKDTTDSTYYLSSCTSATYTTPMESRKDGRKVYCVVTDKYGNSVTSNTATISESIPLVITAQPTKAYAGNGKTVSTSLTATGSGLKYQWYWKNADQTSYSLSSCTGRTYSTTMSAERSGRTVYCVVTDQYSNSVKSNTVTLSLLEITKQPAAVTVANGGTAATSVTANGTNLTYKWYWKNADQTAYSLSSCTGHTYSTTMSADKSGRKVYCVITDKYGNSIKSNVATLTGVTLTITKQPASVIVAQGKTASVSVSASGVGLKYQWYYANAGTSTFIASSQTTATYSIDMNTARDGRKLYCIVTDSAGNTVKTKTVIISME